ncbi:MAG: flavin reductase family protein [Chitinophagaceae bacterium]|nr:flavin reductase family protein [Chitinophagaceae bacterium]
MILELDQLKPADKQYYLQHCIAPRPIAFVSTTDAQGNVNLSPFSFFNLFSINPPVAVFSPSRRVRDNTTKHTLENILQVPEAVINIVTYDMVQQTSLASCEYPKGVNEFVKAGFTPEPALRVKPPMVKESKIKMECRVPEVKSLGQLPGSGNLVICEILLLHLHDELLDEHQKIDQRKIHHVARLGGDWYCRVSEENLFLVEKPNAKLGIGIDNLPESIRNSRILSGNHLGRLANVEALPDIDPAFEDAHLKHIMSYFGNNPDEMENELHRYAAKLLDEEKVREAWQVLLAGG